MKRSILVLFIVFLVATVAQAQYVLKAADKQFNLYNYIEAINYYTKAYKKEQTAYAADRLGQCYQKSLNFKEAEHWYKKADSLPDAMAKSTLNYGLALQANGKYAEAKSVFERYASKGDSSMSQNRVARLIASCDTAKVWMANPKKVEIENQTMLNSNASDWAPVMYNDNVIFTSDRMLTGNLLKNQKKPFLRFDTQIIKPSDKYQWVGKDYARVFQSNLKGDLLLFPLNADTRYHVGAASFTKDGKEIFYALTRMPKRIKKKGKLATINVEIYTSRQGDNGKWGLPISLPINNVSSYSVGDPFIKGDTLYFASNMPGGKGGTDLYFLVRTGDRWGKPQNLSLLNTEGNERSPTQAEDGNFYFASDGYLGMGGLDLFKANNILTSPTIQNLGYPINSSKDDFAVSLSKGGKGINFFSSNRDGGAGDDDIYSVLFPALASVQEESDEITKQAILTGIVYDDFTQKPIEQVKVILTDAEGKSKETLTNEEGAYLFPVLTHRNYEIYGTKIDYFPDTKHLETDRAGTYQKDLYLNAKPPKIKVLHAVLGGDKKGIKYKEVKESIENNIVLPKIYYNFDKYNIRSDAAKQLEKVVAIMQQHPEIKIELSSYTDSRGPAVYNEWLSQERAEKAVNYLVKRGISRNRLIAKGYGETGLVNKCANGVKCPATKHQANRRTEFKIIR